MFQQFKNIDTAFKYTRILTLVTILCNFSLSVFVIISSNRKVNESKKRITVLANGSAFMAREDDEEKYWPIRIRDHVKTFHALLLSIGPDEKANTASITSALSLADNSALTYYQNLKENGYYNNIVAANIVQKLETDSISVWTDNKPWTFQYYGKLIIRRASKVATRSIITRGDIVQLNSPSDNNPHGLQIEKWLVVENKDLDQ